MIELCRWIVEHGEEDEKARLRDLIGLNNSHDFEKVCLENIGTLRNHFKNTTFRNSVDISKKLINVELESQQLENAKADELDTISQHPEIYESYLEAILNSDYWFTSDEVELMAHVYDIHVQLFHKMLGKVEIAGVFNNKSKKTKIVFLERGEDGKGMHFSNCIEET